jgi:hypothetical protein
MAKMFVVWFILAVFIGLLIEGWRMVSGRERWQLTKIAAFSIMCSALAVGLLTIFVILF